jgi:hypothetical protein
VAKRAPHAQSSALVDRKIRLRLRVKSAGSPVNPPFPVYPEEQTLGPGRRQVSEGPILLRKSATAMDDREHSA